MRRLIVLGTALVLLGCSAPFVAPSFKAATWSDDDMRFIGAGATALSCRESPPGSQGGELCVGVRGVEKLPGRSEVVVKITASLKNYGERVESLDLGNSRLDVGGLVVPVYGGLPAFPPIVRDVQPGRRGVTRRAFGFAGVPRASTGCG